MRKMSIEDKNQENGALFFSFIFLYVSSEKKNITPINNPLSRMCILIFFYLAFYIPDIWRTAKSFFRNFLYSLPRKYVTKVKIISLDTLKESYLKNYSLNCYLRQVCHMTYHALYRK